MLLLAALAQAATVAVLDLDGYGVSHAEAAQVAEGLRDALQQDGRLDPISGADVADGIATANEAALREARERVAEARRLQARGDCEGALDPARVAIERYGQALADLGHREELADAWGLLGRCLVATGNEVDARTALQAAVRLWPGYAREKAAAVGGTFYVLAGKAQVALEAGPRRSPDPDRLARAQEALGVDALVVGWLDRQGRVHAELWDEGERRESADVVLVTMPPLAADTAYPRLAARLAEGLPTRGGGRAEPARTVRAPEVPEAPTAEREERAVVRRWWFWTGAFLLLGGGGAAVAAAVVEPAPVVVVEAPSWAVTVVVEP